MPAAGIPWAGEACQRPKRIRSGGCAAKHVWETALSLLRITLSLVLIQPQLERKEQASAATKKLQKASVPHRLHALPLPLPLLPALQTRPTPAGPSRGEVSEGEERREQTDSNCLECLSRAFVDWLNLDPRLLWTLAA
ncbi:unique cartilage matrix-associated protein isoform X1 [Sapajus apella]|uniref:Unique cartilage matrix-associated protein isoform X1 n=1 Tax=Sapajus apella TaxID=9515 RepID=A0A6J3F2Y5_SAPAP|nr:unique cartilage matrix-associated protein isoform X1 [Sapajus apella]